ncbi:hypothetical protein LFM09_01030 [Lentzea alba]|uniref:hypothetical protein n=1 Tax=Lentzea alba TaxID=2714351 RepID=UPI0039BEFF66
MLPPAGRAASPTKRVPPGATMSAGTSVANGLTTVKLSVSDLLPNTKTKYSIEHQSSATSSRRSHRTEHLHLTDVAEVVGVLAGSSPARSQQCH